jgi:hypothetical protein
MAPSMCQLHLRLGNAWLLGHLSDFTRLQYVSQRLSQVDLAAMERRPEATLQIQACTYQK